MRATETGRGATGTETPIRGNTEVGGTVVMGGGRETAGEAVGGIEIVEGTDEVGAVIGMQIGADDGTMKGRGTLAGISEARTAEAVAVAAAVVEVRGAKETVGHLAREASSSRKSGATATTTPDGVATDRGRAHRDATTATREVPVRIARSGRRNPRRAVARRRRLRVAASR